jgi:hypothetical protein
VGMSLVVMWLIFWRLLCRRSEENIFA